MAERKIAGREFKVGTVLATEALRLQFRLMAVIGSGTSDGDGTERLTIILGGLGEEADPEEKLKSNAGALAAMSKVFVHADPDEMTQLVADVVSYAAIKRPSGSYEKADLDGDFTEEKGALIPLCVFVLQEVLSDFFTELRDSGKQLTKLARAG